MKKTLITTGIVVVVLLSALYYFRYLTKSFSPESDVHFEDGELKVHVKYSRPYKKGRFIFGLPEKKDSVLHNPLVPYGKVWRTGANEATIFETNQDLKFGGKILKKGSYSLWTVPGEQTWTVIFNTEHGQWGIDFAGEANREPKDDVLTFEVPAVTQDKFFEQFTISIEKVGEEMELNLRWDNTLVAVTFTK